MFRSKMINSVRFAVAATALAGFGQASFADGLYYGAGIAVYNATSEQTPGAGFESEDTYGAIGGTIGYRFDQPTTFFGAEADLDIAFGSDFEVFGTACSVAASGPYYCEHNATLRLRGIVGAPFGNFEGFASLGFAAMQGQGATSATTTNRGVNTGYTVGLGLQNDMGSGKLRYELVYDNLENVSTNPGGGGEPTFEAVSLKVTYLFN